MTTNVLRFFSTRDACALRQVCREVLAAVSEHPWEDAKTVIKGSLAAWRLCFPRALCANVAQGAGGLRRTPVVDADFVHLEGLRKLNLAGCTSVTDAAFAHLRGIHTLDMSSCCQAGVTDAAFAHLRGISILDVSFCVQASITGEGFAPLRGIEALSMEDCSKSCIAAARRLGLPVLTNDALGAALAMSMLCAKK